MVAMPSGIDHVVIAAPDPDAAAAEITEQVGLAFTAGGRHPGLGTFNRIAFMGDAYLELMGIEDRHEASGWSIGAAAVEALEAGGGFATWALLDDAIRVSVRHLQANGSRIGPVIHGSRPRPDGELVEWWTATPPELAPDRPPLLIKHLLAGAEWGAAGIATRRAFVHPIGSPVRLDGLAVAVDDPFALAAACATEVGMEFAWNGVAAAAATGRQTVRLTQGTGSRAELTIHIGAGVERARQLQLLGVRFVVRPTMAG